MLILAASVVLCLLAAPLVAATTHEFGHLLTRKALGWPITGIEIPRQPISPIVFSAGGVTVRIAPNPTDWLKGGITLPWPLDPAFLCRAPRCHQAAVLAAGSATNALISAAAAALLPFTRLNLPASLFLVATGTVATFVGIQSILPTQSDSDGDWLHRLLRGKPPPASTRRRCRLAALACTVGYGIAMLVVYAWPLL